MKIRSGFVSNSSSSSFVVIAPKNVVEKYRSHLANLYGDNVPVDEEVYIIELDPKKIIRDVQN